MNKKKPKELLYPLLKRALILLFFLIFTGFLDNISVSHKTIVTLIALHYFSVKLAICQGFEGLSLRVYKKVHTFWNGILNGIKKEEKCFLFARSPAAHSGLMAKNRALVSIFTCNRSHALASIAFATKRFFCFLLYYICVFSLTILFKQNL